MRFLSLLLLSGCALVDAAGDEPAGRVSPFRHQYVVSSQLIPTSNDEARSIGLDLDGDGLPNNQVGMAIAAFNVLPLQATLDKAIAEGTVIDLIDLDVDSSGRASVATYLGENPQPAPCDGAGDTVCGRHLSGDAQFEISAGSPQLPPVAGIVRDDTLTTDAGELVFATVLVGKIELVVKGARLELTEVGETELAGTIGGGISQADIESRLIPAWAEQFALEMQASCPGAAPECACTGAAETLRSIFDTNPADCAISLSEVESSTLVGDLLKPDTMIDAQPVLSIGVNIAAVRGGFTPP